MQAGSRAQVTAEGTTPGPLAACARAFEEEFDYVHRTLRRHGVRPADVDDLAQEVFMVMWRRWSEFDARRPLRAWLSGIAFNLVGNYYARAGREVPVADFELVDQSPHGEDALAGARARRMVLAALDRLPEKYRTVLVLRDIDGVPMREIASQQRVALFTAYTRLRRGRQELAAVVRGLHEETARARLRALAWLRWMVGLAAIGVVIAVVLLAARPHPGARLSVNRPEQPPTAQALARGLVGYWRFDEASATVRDLSGGGWNCALHDLDPRQAWVPGRLGGAVDLGGRGWLECAQPALSGGGPQEFTVAAWIKVNRVAARSNHALISRQLGEGKDDYLYLGLNSRQIALNSNSWVARIQRGFAPSGGWQHVAVRRAGGVVSLFLDGRPIGRAPVLQVRRQPVTGPLLLGGGMNRPGEVRELFDGALDELAIFDRALADGEIGALAAGAQPSPSANGRR